ncbi:MAG: ribulokinase [Melioribacteraceae bacterium]|nr:ribulokinase [Melioribacteraceae bacterium]MCF8353180.1 ribulokinase [Melioribacteraceae bacterium]MCF8395156.1 ribulokinase [Melioribacteraceae bacterium]MCF8418023.1 ribulokinase [Melioribacteraceae bacterium]
MRKYTIGLDFGTNSCRALIVDITDGKEIANYVHPYSSGEAGVITDSNDNNLARQNPADYIEGIEVSINNALKKANDRDVNFSSDLVIGIGVSATSSSVMPIDETGTPIYFKEEFRDNKSAMVWLWKDHTSHNEANEITELAAKIRPQYLAKIGGIYSSEWFWSKILKCSKDDPAVFKSTHSFIEISDWLPAQLAGITDTRKIKHNICAAGHKAMFNKEWNGLPDEEFLIQLSPNLKGLRERLYDEAYSSNTTAGYLSKEWAEKLNLSDKVVVKVGAIDAHMGAVGAGIKTGTLIKILGTSTCDIMIQPNDKPIADIPGVAGIVDGSVMNGYFGIEAGQPAVGDIFLWYVNNHVPEKYGNSVDEKFKNLESDAAELKPGQSGLLALDWNNGNRSTLVDVRLTGLILGQTLHTQPHEIYRALIEATAFGALRIIDRIEKYGVEITDVINCGGLAVKNELLMQIYADILGRPMMVSRSEHTPALGATIFASVTPGDSTGGYPDLVSAQSKMTGIGKTYLPNPENKKVYAELYELYKQLYDGFGIRNNNISMHNIMKHLLEIRDSVK